MLALNLHSKWINWQSFFYFKLFICPPDTKRPKNFSGTLLPEPPAGLHHELVMELTPPQDPNLHFTSFENSIFVQKMDISKTAWINAWQSVCIQNVSHISTNFCIQNVSHISINFCIQNVYKMYPTFQQTFVYILLTKFSNHSSLDFVYKMYIEKFVKMCYTFCIHSVYILYTWVAYILNNFCLQNVYTVSMWAGKHWLNISLTM